MDTIQRFVFDDLDVRGAIVRLSESCESIQSTHHYPSHLARVINQFAGAASLLRDSIKIKADLTLQLRSKGPINLIMADCLADSSVRAIADYDAISLPSSNELEFSNFAAGTVMAITITPLEGERYQGIVPIERSTLEGCLEDYFDRSEQLPTRFRLMADTNEVIAISLHALPSEKVADVEESKKRFEDLDALLKTMKFAEAKSLESGEILRRLFHEYQCRLFEPRELRFGCHCSMEKSIDAILALGKEEALQAIDAQKEKGLAVFEVDCHFCFQRYEVSTDLIQGHFDD